MPTLPNYIASNLDGSISEYLTGAGNLPGASYTGQIAGQTWFPNSIANSGPHPDQAQTRSRHRAAVNIISLKLWLPNWWIFGGGNETGTNSALTITASIEFPAGTFTQVKFSGSATGSIPDLSTLVSDAVSINIPAGSFFFVRCWISSTTGFPFFQHNAGVDTANGEACTFSASGGVVDQTLGGTVVNTLNGVMYTPVAIVGTTNQPSIGCLGDSRTFGQNDSYSGTSGDLGEVARSIGPSFAYINGGTPSDQANSFKNSHALRLPVFQNCSHWVCEYGIVDLNGATPASALLTTLQTIWALKGNPSRVFQTTLPPITTGAWTLANGSDQTPATWEAQRVSLNTSIRAGQTGFNTFFEIANQDEPSQNAGKWIANGTPGFWTADGIHESNAACLGIAASGAIPTSAFHF